jgi:hypothetical protein
MKNLFVVLGMVVLGSATLAGFVSAAQGADLPAGREAGEKKALEPKAPVVGGVTMLPDKAGVEITGKVCQEEGILDFLGVVAGGREYESVLSLDVKPSVLHAALLAMGAKPGPTSAYIEWKKKKDAEAGQPVKALEPGSKLKITLSWKTPEGLTKEIPATSALFNRKTKTAEPESNAWIFSGSYFAKTLEEKTVYVADEEGAVIGVVTEPGAVINLSQDAGNPYDSPDEGFVPNKKDMPPRGTTLVVRISLAAASGGRAGEK